MRDRSMWTLHVLSGLVILVLLGLHMAIMHLNTTLGIYNAPGHSAIDWASVVMRMKSTGFAVSYILLLAFALYHGLYGLRNILLELNPGKGLRALISYTILLVGLGLFGFGAYVAAMAPAASTAVGG